jgi:hypothetical protein
VIVFSDDNGSAESFTKPLAALFVRWCRCPQFGTCNQFFGVKRHDIRLLLFLCARPGFRCTNLERAMTKKCLISVVDDDQCVREGLEHLIHSMDCYRVASFASAEEYLQSDLVPYTSYLISDYQMPGMTGADLQNRLIAAGYRIPIIFLSANCSEEDRN